MKILIKLDRLSAWVLFACMLLYFVSGYGMEKGIIDSSFAVKLHMNILTYIVLVAFAFHTSYAIHLALKRWQIWNMGTKITLLTFFIAFFGSFVYIDRYYQSKVDSEEESTITNSTTAANDNSNITASNSNNLQAANQKTFTVSELLKYNGQNGNPAYVAVDGDVYDLTSVFQAGSHYSHLAGTELTNAFYARHAKNALSKYPIVGQLAK